MNSCLEIGPTSFRYQLKVPVKKFWAVTAYDPVSRSLLDSGGQITVSSLRDHKVNSDGSVDVFFGPVKPEGVNETNWIKTAPKKGILACLPFLWPTRDRSGQDMGAERP